MSITYTFPADCPIPQLRGITCTGGKFARHMIDRKAVDVCCFDPVNGKSVMARVFGKPELEAAFAAQLAAEAQAKAKKRAALEAAVPGLAEYEAASRAYSNAICAYDRACDRGGYPVNEGAAAKTTEEALQQVYARHPATRLWRKIEAYTEASNYSKAAAGREARRSVEAGADLAASVANMEADWSAAAAQAVYNS